jgi:hypothetical protein
MFWLGWDSIELTIFGGVIGGVIRESDFKLAKITSPMRYGVG